MQLAIMQFTEFLVQKTSITKPSALLEEAMGSTSLAFLGAMYVLRKAEKLVEKVAERLAKYLHVALLPLGVMAVLKKAEKLAEKVAERLAANQEEILMHSGHDCYSVESASLQSQRLNHGSSSIACHHLWTSASLQQPLAHAWEET